MKFILPRYGDKKPTVATYAPGYIGFTYKDTGIVSLGIAWFTREEAEKIVVSHTFIVRDQDTLVEAEVGRGVTIRPISDYFDDPHRVVFFKKPINLDLDRAYTLVRRAVGKVGRRYNYSEFLYFMCRKLFLHEIEKKFPLLKKKPSIFASSQAWICSSLCADSLNQIEEYSKCSPLSEYHISKIDPMDLFRSTELFEPWHFE